MPTKPISIRIDKELLDRLTARAEQEHRTLSNLITSILADSTQPWSETDLWRFTAEHPDCYVKSWGGYIGKRDGYEPYGYQIDFDKKLYYFGLDGHFIKAKAQ